MSANKSLKTIFIIIIILFLFSNTIEQKNDFADRNILIIPFYNISKVKEFNHFSSIIYETVKLELNKHHKFKVVNNENILKQLKIMGIKKRLLKESEIKKIGIRNNADVVVYGIYKIKNNNITLTIKAYDLVNEKNININEIKGSIGLDLFRLIDLSSIVFTKRMKQEIEMVENEKYKKKIQDIKEDIEIRELIFVKGNKFILGYKKGNLNEKPPHEVLVNDFYISKYEITQKEWESIMESNPSVFKGKLLPVHNITWYEAVVFCNLKSIKEDLKPYYKIKKEEIDKNNKNNNTDKYKWSIECDKSSNGYRLPTEAEWEYAYSSGRKSENITNDKKFNYIINPEYQFTILKTEKKIDFANEIYEDANINKIGKMKPNELNIFDMEQNVMEWCWDWYNSKYYNYSEYDNPQGNIEGYKKVVKGGYVKVIRYKGYGPERLSQKPFLSGIVKVNHKPWTGGFQGYNRNVKTIYIGLRVVKNISDNKK